MGGECRSFYVVARVAGDAVNPSPPLLPPLARVVACEGSVVVLMSLTYQLSCLLGSVRPALVLPWANVVLLYGSILVL
jgi:hypothetical protein